MQVGQKTVSHKPGVGPGNQPALDIAALSEGLKLPQTEALHTTVPLTIGDEVPYPKGLFAGKFRIDSLFMALRVFVWVKTGDFS